MGGRSISRDPLRFRGGDINLYRAFNNNGVNFLGPLGLNCTLISTTLIGYSEPYGTGSFVNQLNWNLDRENKFQYSIILGGQDQQFDVACRCYWNA